MRVTIIFVRFFLSTFPYISRYGKTPNPDQMKASGGFCPICQDTYQVVLVSNMTYDPTLRSPPCFTANTFSARSAWPLGLTGILRVLCAGGERSPTPDLLILQGQGIRGPKLEGWSNQPVHTAVLGRLVTSDLWSDFHCWKLDSSQSGVEYYCYVDLSTTI